MNYVVYDKENNEKNVILLEVEDNKWVDLLSEIIRTYTKSKKITIEDIEKIDSNYCIPFCICPTISGSKNIVSLVCGDIGKLNLRLWLGENGIRSTFISFDKVGGSLELLKKFLKWWDKLPTVETVKVGKFMVTKRTQSFGIGHVQAWISTSLNIKTDGSADSKYISEATPWAYAYELIIDWKHNNLIIDESGFMTVNKNKI